MASCRLVAHGILPVYRGNILNVSGNFFTYPKQKRNEFHKILTPTRWIDQIARIPCNWLWFSLRFSRRLAPNIWNPREIPLKFKESRVIENRWVFDPVDLSWMWLSTLYIIDRIRSSTRFSNNGCIRSCSYRVLWEFHIGCLWVLFALRWTLASWKLRLHFYMQTYAQAVKYGSQPCEKLPVHFYTCFTFSKSFNVWNISLQSKYGLDITRARRMTYWK